MKKVIVILFILISGQAFSLEFGILAVGENAIDFKLKTILGEDVQFKEINELPRGKPARYRKANAQGESGTDPRVGVFNQKENKNYPVVFIVLRRCPGYQCPIC